MPKVSAKRQITLPVDQCAVAGINPGDGVVSFVDRSGIISIVKKPPELLGVFSKAAKS